MPPVATQFRTSHPATATLHFTKTVPAGAEMDLAGTKAGIFNFSKPGAGVVTAKEPSIFL